MQQRNQDIIEMIPVDARSEMVETCQRIDTAETERQAIEARDAELLGQIERLDREAKEQREADRRQQAAEQRRQTEMAAWSACTCSMTEPGTSRPFWFDITKSEHHEPECALVSAEEFQQRMAKQFEAAEEERIAELDRVVHYEQQRPERMAARGFVLVTKSHRTR